ncbi:MAG: cupin domain-containing protein [Actinobacteria bacterium]|nr:cupin domain-containing protein [Actinomycetota bacterium]
MTEPPNIWRDSWEFESQEEWAASRSTRLPRGDRIGASLYEIAPGTTGGLYHFHHGAEELLVVLRGRPTLRAPEGERELEEGAVVLFPVGPEGAHQLINRTEQPVRYLVASNRPSPEAVEYPDSRQLSVMAFSDSQFGAPLWDLRTLDEASS